MKKYLIEEAMVDGKECFYVYYLPDKKKKNIVMNRRYCGNFDRKDRAEEYAESLMALERETNE